jgi:predicted PurR-regulated permease PerM
VTTIAVFAAVLAAAFAARTTLLVFIFGMLLAYLLEPIVGGLERLLGSRPHARGISVAVVCLGGLLLAAAAAYAAAPTMVDEWRRLRAGAPEITAGIDGVLGRGRGDAIREAVSRWTRGLAAGVGDMAWLLLVPPVAIFFLGKRTVLLDGAVALFARRRDRAAAQRTVQQIDGVLAEYARAELTLSSLSALYYAVVMALLGYPYPVVLGVAGGILEIVPGVGWMVAAAAILGSGWIAHRSLIWMGIAILVWRGVQNLITSPQVMGGRLKMEPITVVFAMLVGSQLCGPAGVILSIPAIAVVRVLRQDCEPRASVAPVAAVNA